MEQSNRFYWSVVAGLVLINAALHVLMLNVAPYLDEGNFAIVGKWIADGDVFYRDMSNERGPLTYLFVAFWFLLAPASITSLRFAALLFSSIQIVLLALLARRWFAGRWALAAPAFYAFWHGWLFGTIFRSEQIDGVLVLTAVLAADLGGPVAWIGSGTALSLLVMEKQNGLVALLLFFAFVVYRASGRRLRAAAICGASVAAPWAALLFAYGRIGEIPALVKGVLFPFSSHYISSYAAAADHYGLLLALPSVLALVLYLAVNRKNRDARWFLLALWSVAALAMAVPKFFIYQILALQLPTSVAFAGLAQSVYRCGRRSVAVAATALYVAISIGSIVISLRPLTEHFDPVRTRDLEQMADAIRANTTENDRIWVFPHESTLYLLADRRSASHHQFLLPWIASPCVVDRILAELQASPPVYVVYTNRFRDTSPGQLPAEFAAPIVDYLVGSYEPELATENGLILLRRNVSHKENDPVQRDTMRRIFDR